MSHDTIDTPKTSVYGELGLALSFSALFCGIVPIFGFCIWVLGLIFSLIGLFKAPREWAALGVILSIFAVVIWVEYLSYPLLIIDFLTP